MAVQHRNTYALAGDNGAFSLYDHAPFNGAPKAQRLLLALFFLPSDIRNNIALHLRPVLKGLSSAGNSLIGCCHHLIGLKFLPCGQSRRIALNRAIRLNCNKAPFSSQTLSLEGNHLKMLWVDLRHYHRNIRSPAVSAVIGDNRSLSLCIRFLNSLNLILCHIHCAEYEIHAGSHCLHLIYIHHNQLFNRFWHRRGHFPAVSYCLLIGFSR